MGSSAQLCGTNQAGQGKHMYMVRIRARRTCLCNICASRSVEGRMLCCKWCLICQPETASLLACVSGNFHGYYVLSYPLYMHFRKRFLGLVSQNQHLIRPQIMLIFAGIACLRQGKFAAAASYFLEVDSAHATAYSEVWSSLSCVLVLRQLDCRYTPVVTAAVLSTSTLLIYWSLWSSPSKDQYASPRDVALYTVLCALATYPRAALHQRLTTSP